MFDVVAPAGTGQPTRRLVREKRATPSTVSTGSGNGIDTPRAIGRSPHADDRPLSLARSATSCSVSVVTGLPLGSIPTSTSVSSWQSCLLIRALIDYRCYDIALHGGFFGHTASALRGSTTLQGSHAKRQAPKLTSTTP